MVPCWLGARTAVGAMGTRPVGIYSQGPSDGGVVGGLARGHFFGGSEECPGNPLTKSLGNVGMEVGRLAQG